MKTSRRITALATAACLCAALQVQALAATQILFGPQAWHGPGSRGAKVDCIGTFSTTNALLQSNNFSTAPWTTLGGVNAPVINSTTAIAPDGSATATEITFPTVGAGITSAIAQTPVTNEIARYAYTHDLQVQVVTLGAGAPYLASYNSGATVFKSKAAIVDGAWHPLSLFYRGQTFTASPYLTFGIDTRDAAQKPTTGPITVRIWHGQITGGAGSFPYIPTTTATVTVTQTIHCPAGVTFPDTTRFAPYANKITTQNAGEPCQAGGISNPYPGPGWFVGGKYYALASGTNTTNHNDWTALNWYSAVHPLNWTEESAFNPTAQMPGSNCATGTRGTGANLVYYGLKPAILPSGCTVSAAFYKYCFVYSAMNATNTSAIFLGYANSIPGTFAVTTTPIILSTATPGSAAKPSLPSVIQTTIDGVCTYFMYTSTNNNNGTLTNAWTSSCVPGAVDGFNWTFATTAMNAPLSSGVPNGVSGADWDYASLTGIIDSYVLPPRGRCNFYMHFYTDFYSVGRGANNVLQAIGLSVGPGPYGPWFKMQGPVFPYTSPLYNSTPYIGNNTAMSLNGMFFWIGGYDNGTNNAGGIAATMLDPCAY